MSEKGSARREWHWCFCFQNCGSTAGLRRWKGGAAKGQKRHVGFDHGCPEVFQDVHMWVAEIPWGGHIMGWVVCPQAPRAPWYGSAGAKGCETLSPTPDFPQEWKKHQRMLLMVVMAQYHRPQHALGASPGFSRLRR